MRLQIQSSSSGAYDQIDYYNYGIQKKKKIDKRDLREILFKCLLKLVSIRKNLISELRMSTKRKGVQLMFKRYVEEYDQQC